MSPIPYTLIQPVEVSFTRPGNERRPEKVETLTFSEVARRRITGWRYFEIGDVSVVNASNGGSISIVEIDDRIDAYLSHQLVDPKTPDSAQVFEALTLPDCWALREDLVAEFRTAAMAARKAREDAAPDSVTLLEPFEFHQQPVKVIPLKEPKHKAFRRFGSPWTWSRLAGGEMSSVERIDVVAKYLEGCVDHELGRDVVNSMSLADAMQLKLALLGFFSRAAETASGARKSTSSSSDESA